MAKQFRREGKVAPAGVGRARARGSGVYDLRKDRGAGWERMQVDEAHPRVEDENEALNEKNKDRNRNEREWSKEQNRDQAYDQKSGGNMMKNRSHYRPRS